MVNYILPPKLVLPLRLSVFETRNSLFIGGDFRPSNRSWMGAQSHALFCFTPPTRGSCRLDHMQLEGLEDNPG